MRDGENKCISAEKLARLLSAVPGCTVQCNAVGNLMVLSDDKYIGFIDFGDESLHLFEPPGAPA